MAKLNLGPTSFNKIDLCQLPGNHCRHGKGIILGHHDTTQLGGPMISVQFGGKILPDIRISDITFCPKQFAARMVQAYLKAGDLNGLQRYLANT